MLHECVYWTTELHANETVQLLVAGGGNQCESMQLLNNLALKNMEQCCKAFDTV